MANYSTLPPGAGAPKMALGNWATGPWGFVSPSFGSAGHKPQSAGPIFCPVPTTGKTRWSPRRSANILPNPLRFAERAPMLFLFNPSFAQSALAGPFPTAPLVLRARRPPVRSLVFR